MHWNTARMYKMQWDSLTVKLNGPSCVTFQCCRIMFPFHMALSSSDLKMYAQTLASSIHSLMMIAQLNTPSSILSTNSELTQTKLSNLPKQETFACNMPSASCDDQESHLETLFPADPKTSPSQETSNSLASHMVNPPFGV